MGGVCHGIQKIHHEGRTRRKRDFFNNPLYFLTSCSSFLRGEYLPFLGIQRSHHLTGMLHGRPMEEIRNFLPRRHGEEILEDTKGKRLTPEVPTLLLMPPIFVFSGFSSPCLRASVVSLTFHSEGGLPGNMPVKWRLH